jgi:hypothetical protein
MVDDSIDDDGDGKKFSSLWLLSELVLVVVLVAEVAAGVIVAVAMSSSTNIDE